MTMLRLLGLFAAIGLLFSAKPIHAAVWTVTNTNDSGAGSLPSAILSADADSGDTIDFSSGLTGTITLASALPTITTAMTIQGPGASVIAIDGASEYRPFNINAPGDAVTITGITIQHGNYQPSNAGGGGIYLAAGSLTLDNCVLSDNRTGDDGGALYNLAGTCTLAYCTLTGNEAGYGAAINNSGTTTLTNCTLSSNVAAGDGGAIFNYTGTVTITDCTLSNNNGGNAGGAIDNGATIALTNCTLADNTSGQGGGIMNTGPATLTNCTITGNTATTIGGGGIFDYYANATLTNCILYGDTGTGGEVVITSGTVAATYCDVQGGYTGIGDINANPLFDAAGLANNGGTTQTIALDSGSPCFGTGTATGAPTTDQRGETRPNPPSIGAYDYAAAITFAPGLNFFSSPYNYGTESLDTILGYTGAELAAWLTANNAYSVTPQSGADAITLGVGYWARFPRTVALPTGGTAADTTKNYDITLPAGWVSVGNPFLSTVPVSNLIFNKGGETMAQAISTGLVGDTIWDYDATTGQYEAATSLNPGVGYWIYAISATDVQIPHP